MKQPIALSILALLCGCAGQKTKPSDVTNARVLIQHGTNVAVSIEQPKDTVAKGVDITFPDGARVHFDEYQSTANAAALEAVKAQSQAQAETVKAGFQFGENMFVRGMEAAAKGAMKGAKP